MWASTSGFTPTSNIWCINYFLHAGKKGAAPGLVAMVEPLTSAFSHCKETHSAEILIEWLSYVHATAPTFTAGWSCVTSRGSSLQTSTFVLWWDNELGRKSCCLIKVRFQHSAGEYRVVGRSSIWRRCTRFKSGGELHFFPSQLPLVGSGSKDGKQTRLLETGSSSFPGLSKVLSSSLANGNGEGNVLLSARESPPQRDPRKLWGL